MGLILQSQSNVYFAYFRWKLGIMYWPEKCSVLSYIWGSSKWGKSILLIVQTFNQQYNRLAWTQPSRWMISTLYHFKIWKQMSSVPVIEVFVCLHESTQIYWRWIRVRPSTSPTGLISWERRWSAVRRRCVSLTCPPSPSLSSQWVRSVLILFIVMNLSYK